MLFTCTLKPNPDDNNRASFHYRRNCLPDALCTSHHHNTHDKCIRHLNAMFSYSLLLSSRRSEYLEINIYTYDWGVKDSVVNQWILSLLDQV